MTQPDFISSSSSHQIPLLSPNQPPFFANEGDGFGASLGPPFQYQPSTTFFGEELSSMGMSPPSPPTTGSLGRSGDPSTNGEFFSSTSALPLSNQHLANLAAADPNPSARPVMGSRSRSNSRAADSSSSSRNAPLSLSLTPSNGEPFPSNGLPLSPSTTKSISAMSSLPASPNSLSAAFPTNPHLASAVLLAQSPTSHQQGGDWGQALSQASTPSYFNHQSMEQGFYDAPNHQQPSDAQGSIQYQSQPPSPLLHRAQSSNSLGQGTMNPNHASSSNSSSQQQTPSPTSQGRPRSTTVGSGIYQPSPVAYDGSVSSGTNNNLSPVAPQTQPFVFGQNLAAGFGSSQGIALVSPHASTGSIMPQFDPSSSSSYELNASSFSEPRNTTNYGMDSVEMGRSRSEESEMEGMLTSGHLIASGFSSGELSRQAGSSSGQGTGGVITPDLSSRVKAMSLESRLRDIEGIINASAKVNEQAAAIRTALIDGRGSELPHGDLKEIGNTLKAIASLDGQVPQQLTLLQPGIVPIQLVESHANHGHGIVLDQVGGGFGASLSNHAPPPSSSSLTVDVGKSLNSKRPAPLSSPVPVHDVPHSTKHPRRSDVMEESEPTPIDIQPPPLLHAHSFPSVQHQVLPSQSLVPPPMQTRSASSLGLAQSLSPPNPASSSLQAVLPQQHAPINPSPLAFSTSRPPSPNHYEHQQQFLSSLDLPPALQQQHQLQQQDPSMFTTGWGSSYASPAPPQGYDQSEPMQQQAPSSSSSSALDTFPPETMQFASVPAPPPAPVHPGPPSRRASNADGRPVVRLRGLTMTSDSEPPILRNDPSPPNPQPQTSESSPEEVDELSEESDSEPAVKRRTSTRRRRSSAQVVEAEDEDVKPTATVLSDDLRRQLDQIFQTFLSAICSDLNITDRKGEQIHQTLMAKKMQRLDESWDFRPFKFRIQAFTNAFTERLVAAGLSDDIMPTKKIKYYLWTQPYISRFNDDGKKAKSKGNHIWNVEAKKDGEGGWHFKRFERRITGNFSQAAYIGVPWQWAPRVWDPHTTASTIKAVFSSPPGSLPTWLAWTDNVLAGTAPVNAMSVEIETIASYTEDLQPRQLRQTNDLTVTSFAQEQAGMAASRQFIPPPPQAPAGTFFQGASPPHQQQFVVDPHQHPNFSMAPAPPAGYPIPPQHMHHIPSPPDSAPIAYQSGELHAAQAAVVQAVEVFTFPFLDASSLVFLLADVSYSSFLLSRKVALVDRTSKDILNSFRNHPPSLKKCSPSHIWRGSSSSSRPVLSRTSSPMPPSRTLQFELSTPSS
ncbi:hypothetical protein BDY24DRAFT_254910 [Mrakia frigida]|uniref:uncharacterized protein n=1 Tax=Mrakia frigida TaxID=29902 RepID=UPI003FCC2642